MHRKTFSPIRKRVHGVFALLAAGILSFLFFTSCNSISHDELSEQEETTIHDLLARRAGKESISREERLAFEKRLHSVPAMGYILKSALTAKDDALFCWIAETKDFDEVFREAVEADPKLLTMACTRESMNWFISIYCESPFLYQPFDVLGNKLVHLHASHENCDGLKRLLPFQTDVNAKNNRGFTPLHIAFLYGNMDNIETLLKYNADIQAKSYSGKTCLHCAAMRKDDDAVFVRFLLENGADINALDAEGNTPLHYAFALGNEEIVKLLIEKGADVRIRNKQDKLYSDKDVSEFMLNLFY